MSDERPLDLLAIGLELPPPVDVVELAAVAGVDTSGYKSWRHACHVRDDEDQPSTMGARALGRALAAGRLGVDDLDLVVFTGVSRDYPASWSVGTEILHLLGASSRPLGIDLSLGCAATLSALDLVKGWLTQRGGGRAAVVAGERWSYTVNPRNPASRTWAWADGAAAAVVGVDAAPGWGAFLGAEFSSEPSYNGHVLIKYGGTRNPVAPPGVDPHTRIVSGRDRDEIRATYVRGYTAAYERLVERVGVRGERLVCNQIAPLMVSLVAEGLGIEPEMVVMSGPELGHVGAADILIGLERLRAVGDFDAPVLLGSSTAYAYGVGVAVPATLRSR